MAKNLQQKPGTPLQERKTKMDWEQITNTIEEVFGIASDGKQQEKQDTTEQSSEERRIERKREFIENQQEGTGLENREERNREAIGRAQGRLPAREARRRQQKSRQQQQRGGEKWKDQQQDERKDRYYNDFPLYEFSYGVHDPETGDTKEQWEKRVGDHVKGKYTLDQPDGTQRVVEYEADDKSGFEAIVKEIDRIDDRHRGDVRWGHSDGRVAQSYSKLKKVD
uniref:Uncharacterized protein n=1 Tax=Anopheles stephensi TaxID=30069 RepID=A0A182Y854_ANOST